jgi:fumarylacetoacetate (FAA) hydrolase
VKLASLRQGGRDGTLVVVDNRLERCVRVRGIAPTLQAALDDWTATEPLLHSIANRLGLGEIAETEPFDPAACAAPLPRAYQFADGSAFLSHMELVRRARGAEMPASFRDDPLIYQGLSDGFLGPRDPIVLADADWGIDFEAEVAVVLDDVPMGISAADAGRHIKLIMLCNDVSLRNLVPGEAAKGFGFYQSKPASAFSPVAATPESLAEAWDGARLHRPLISQVNGREIGRPDAGVDMTFGFPELIAHAARTRRLGAGTILGSGTVSNKDHRRVGSSCLAEVRAIETIEHGQPKTPFLQFGDTVRIEMLAATGASIFGAIEQRVAPAPPG